MARSGWVMGGKRKQTQALSRRGENGTTQGVWADARAEGQTQRWQAGGMATSRGKKTSLIISEKGRKCKAGGWAQAGAAQERAP